MTDYTQGIGTPRLPTSPKSDASVPRAGLHIDASFGVVRELRERPVRLPAEARRNGLGDNALRYKMAA
jgi:hypothetical protein